jgi:transcriptional regulator with XRE-family HTH domain
MTQLAKASGVAVETIRRMMFKTATPDVETVAAVADALGVDRGVVSGWVGLQRSVRARYDPPAEADLLTERERAALDQLIRAIAARAQEASTPAAVVAVESEDNDYARARVKREQSVNGDGSHGS